MARKEPNSTNLGMMAARSPAIGVKGWIRNLILFEEGFSDTLEFKFRPTEVREQVSAVYEKMRVMGMSHQYASYSHTENFSFSFTLYFNALMIMKEISTQGSIQRISEGNKELIKEGSATDLTLISSMIEEDRRFLESLLLPYAGPGGVIGVSPPPIILCLPGILTLRMRVTSLGLSFTDCDIRGNIKELSIDISVEEAPMARITMQDHLAAGCIRMWGI